MLQIEMKISEQNASCYAYIIENIVVEAESNAM